MCVYWGESCTYTNCMAELYLPQMVSGGTGGPSGCAPVLVKMAVLMPTNRPELSSKGPPLLPVHRGGAWCGELCTGGGMVW